MSSGSDGEASSVADDIPSWLVNLLIFELVTIALHQVFAAGVFIQRRHKWPIRGRAVWLVALTVLVFPLEQFIRVLREINSGGLGCGAVFFGIYVCTLFGIASCLVRVWRVWFEYYYACAKVKIKDISSAGNQLHEKDVPEVKDTAVILMSKTLEDEIVSSSGETSRRSAGSSQTADEARLPSGTMYWFYRYHKYVKTAPMIIAVIIFWAIAVAAPLITYLATPTPSFSSRGCELEDTSTNQAFFVVCAFTAFVVLFTAYKLRRVADGYLIVREMKYFMILTIVLAAVGIAFSTSDIPPVHSVVHITTVIMHSVIAFLVTVPTALSFLSDRRKKHFISSMLRKAKENSQASRNDTMVSLGLQLILDSPALSERFLEFLKSEWGVENYLFFRDVDSYESAHRMLRIHTAPNDGDQSDKPTNLDTEETKQNDVHEDGESVHFETESLQPQSDDGSEHVNSPRMPNSRRCSSVSPSGPNDMVDQTSEKDDQNGVGDASRKEIAESLRRDTYRRAALIYYTYVCSDAIQPVNISSNEKDEIDEHLSACFRKLPRTLDSLRRLAARKAAQAPPKNISTSRRTSKDESSLSQSIEAIGVHTIEEGKPLSQVRHRRPFASLESIWDAAENTFIPLSCLEVDIDAELSSEVFANSKRSIFHLMEYDCYIRFMGKQDKNELSELSRKSDVRSTSV